MTACTYRIYGTVMNMMTNLNCLTMKYYATKSSGCQLNGKLSRAVELSLSLPATAALVGRFWI